MQLLLISTPGARCPKYKAARPLGFCSDAVKYVGSYQAEAFSLTKTASRRGTGPVYLGRRKPASEGGARGKRGRMAARPRHRKPAAANHMQALGIFLQLRLWRRMQIWFWAHCVRLARTCSESLEPPSMVSRSRTCTDAAAPTAQIFIDDNAPVFCRKSGFVSCKKGPLPSGDEIFRIFVLMQCWLADSRASKVEATDESPFFSTRARATDVDWGMGPGKGQSIPCSRRLRISTRLHISE